MACEICDTPGSVVSRARTSGNLETPVQIAESVAGARRGGFAPFTRIPQNVAVFGENAPFLGACGRNMRHPARGRPHRIFRKSRGARGISGPPPMAQSRRVSAGYADSPDPPEFGENAPYLGGGCLKYGDPRIRGQPPRILRGSRGPPPNLRIRFSAHCGGFSPFTRASRDTSGFRDNAPTRRGRVKYMRSPGPAARRVGSSWNLEISQRIPGPPPTMAPSPSPVAAGLRLLRRFLTTRQNAEKMAPNSGGRSKFETPRI